MGKELDNLKIVQFENSRISKLPTSYFRLLSSNFLFLTSDF
jgi:hypothetical protein